MEKVPRIEESQARQRITDITIIGTPREIDDSEKEDLKSQTIGVFSGLMYDGLKGDKNGGKLVIQDEWRTVPGYVLEVLNKLPIPQFVHSRFAQFQVLLGRFLFNASPSPLTDLPLFEDSFEWGRVPLEKVIWDESYLNKLALNPFASRNSVCIIEPCQFVGFNDFGRGVRASKNIAYLIQMVANCDSILVPLWHSGVDVSQTITGLVEKSEPPLSRSRCSLTSSLTASPVILPSSSLPADTYLPLLASESADIPQKPSLDTLISILTSSRSVIVEGGSACAYDPTTFTDTLPLNSLLAVIQNVMLWRLQMKAPSIFICIGHQLACEALTRLVIQITDDVRAECKRLVDMGSELPEWLRELNRIVERIDETGKEIEIFSEGSDPIRGYRHPQFTVTKNCVAEVGTKRLRTFTPLNIKTHPLPHKLFKAHTVTAHRYCEYNLLSMLTKKFGVGLDIVMFHTDRVNYEAVLFDNWVFSKLHTFLIQYKNDVALSSFSWLLNLPSGIEISASTTLSHSDGSEEDVHSLVAATTIFYEDFDTTTVRSSFTLQFHPELFDNFHIVSDDLGDGNIFKPTYEELRQKHGAQLLCRMLHTNSHLS